MSPERTSESSEPESNIRYESLEGEEGFYYQHAEVPPNERDAPSQYGIARIEGQDFHREVTERYPICIGRRQELVQMLDTRSVRMVVYRNEARQGLQFTSAKNSPNYDGLPLLPTTPSQAHEAFVRSGETSEDPEVVLRLEQARHKKASVRKHLDAQLQVTSKS